MLQLTRSNTGEDWFLNDTCSVPKLMSHSLLFNTVAPAIIKIIHSWTHVAVVNVLIIRFGVQLVLT